MIQYELCNSVTEDDDRSTIITFLVMIVLQKFALQLVLPVVTFFGFTACFSSFLIHTHHMRKVVVGSVGLVASVSMYSSPMVAAVSICHI